jgi:hypothetical protein
MCIVVWLSISDSWTNKSALEFGGENYNKSNNPQPWTLFKRGWLGKEGGERLTKEKQVTVTSP